MKEFCIKHPIITLLIVDEACTMIYNCVAAFINAEPRVRIAKRVVNDVEKGIHEVVNKIKEKETVETGFH